MTTLDPCVDLYIGKAAAFAQPILQTLRARLHAACGDLDETIKWGMPFFIRGGRNLCHMAAFKAHCAFGFAVAGLSLPEVTAAARAMGDFGRITTLTQLPDTATLGMLLAQASGRALQPSPPRPRPAPRAEPDCPDDLARALHAHPQAQAAFAKASPSHRREYIQWIVEAKRPDTRERRVARTVAQVEAGERLYAGKKA